MLIVGSVAPDFTLPSANGDVALSAFRGKKVILYFYSKDMTGGCTTQAVGYKEVAAELQSLNAVVIGVSKDSVKSHIRFAEKYELPFVLLSDEDLSVIRAYEAWGEKKMYGKTVMGVIRTTYIIDEQGVIASAEGPVKAATDPQKTLEKVRAL